MRLPSGRKWITGALLVAGLWFGVKYALPVAIPFLLGASVALAAEPLVNLGVRWKLPRGVAAGVGVTVTLILFLTVLSFLGALAVRELIDLAEDLPDIQNTAKKGMGRLEGWLTDLAAGAPKGVRPLLTKTVEQSFAGGNAVFDRMAAQVPGAVTGILTWIPKGAVGLFTFVLSGFLISARLDKFRLYFREKMPPSWYDRYLPALRQTKTALGGWVKAQGKLALITWGIVALGLWLLKIPYGILWAGLIALVDAVPVLGTGTVLVPWALVCFLQGQTMQGVWLLCIYGAALITRTVLEPRLVGKQLGLDPLITLAAFYVGFSLFGFLGMVLAPVLAAATGAVIGKK